MLSSRMRVKPFAMVEPVPYGIVINYDRRSDGTSDLGEVIPLNLLFYVCMAPLGDSHRSPPNVVIL